MYILAGPGARLGLVLALSSWTLSFLVLCKSAVQSWRRLDLCPSWLSVFWSWLQDAHCPCALSTIYPSPSFFAPCIFGQDLLSMEFT